MGAPLQRGALFNRLAPNVTDPALRRPHIRQDNCRSVKLLPLHEWLVAAIEVGVQALVLLD